MTLKKKINGTSKPGEKSWKIVGFFFENAPLLKEKSAKIARSFNRPTNGAKDKSRPYLKAYRSLIT